MPIPEFPRLIPLSVDQDGPLQLLHIIFSNMVEPYFMNQRLLTIDGELLESRIFPMLELPVEALTA